MDSGAKAPYAGYLLPPETVKSLYNNDIELSLSKKTVENLNLQIIDYETRVKNYQDQNDKLATRLEHANSSFFEKTGYFILGAVITGAVSYAVYRSH